MSPKPSATPSIRSATAIAADTRCKYVAASGRRCRALAARDTSRASGFSAFCLPHSQMEQQYLDSESVTKELLGDVDDFRTSHAVNEILRKLFIAVAQNRIPLRNASALSYICQLLIASTTGVRGELRLKGGEEELFVVNRTTDLLYGTGDDAEHDEESEEESEEQNESDQPEQQEEDVQVSGEQKNNFQAQVAAAVKILDGQ